MPAAVGVNALMLPCKSFEDAARRWEAAFKIPTTPRRSGHSAGWLSGCAILTHHG